MNESTKEQEILMTMRKVLAAIIRDVTPPPGMKHPLTERTIVNIRDCFALIAARERELAEVRGVTMERPVFTDERPVAEVIPLQHVRRTMPINSADPEQN